MKKIVSILVGVALAATSMGVTAFASNEDVQAVDETQSEVMLSVDDIEYVEVSDLSQLDTDEIINVKFTEQYSPYIVEDYINVIGNILIEPGTEFQFYNNSTLFADNVKAVGTVEKPIVFKSSDTATDKWDGLYISNGNYAEFEYCEFYNSNDALCDLRDMSSDEYTFSVKNCKFIDNVTSIYCDGYVCNIENCLFNNNNTDIELYGDYKEVEYSGRIYNCVFNHDEQEDKQDLAGIRMFADGAGVDVQNCEFYNKGTAIYASYWVENDSYKPFLIKKCFIDNCDSAVYLDRENVAMLNNTITNCMHILDINENDVTLTTMSNCMLANNEYIIKILKAADHTVVGEYDLSYNCFKEGVDNVNLPETDEYIVFLNGCREYNDMRGSINVNTSIMEDIVTVTMNTVETELMVIDHTPVCAEVYMAVYDKETGVLLDVEKENSVVMEEDRTVTFDISNKDYANDDVDIKVFVWDQLVSMSPIEIVE